MLKLEVVVVAEGAHGAAVNRSPESAQRRARSGHRRGRRYGARESKKTAWLYAQRSGEYWSIKEKRRRGRRLPIGFAGVGADGGAFSHGSCRR